MNKSEIQDVARATRRVIRELLKEHSDWADPKDMLGACGCASWALWTRLPSSRLVLGTWDDITHCWVEYDKYIVDITATQFGFAPVRIVLKNRKAGQLYVQESFNQKAVAELATWYSDGWRREVSSRMKRHGLSDKRAA